MTDQETSRTQFPVRLSRRLAMGTAIGVTAFLLGAGLSVILSLNIVHLHRSVDEERQHLQMASEVETAFSHLIFELQAVQLIGNAGPWDLRLLHRDLWVAVDRFRAIHLDDSGLPEDVRERAAFAWLAESGRSLEPIVEMLARHSGATSPLQPGDLETLGRIAHRVPEEVGALATTHEIRITRLLEMSRRIERVILVLYLAMFTIGCILVIVAGRTLHREIAVPLQRLAAATRRLAEGRFAEWLPVKRRDEIGQLSQAFNVMAERLQERERELCAVHAGLERKVSETAILYEIAGKILALDGPRGILRAIADAASAKLGFDAAVLCVAGSEPGTLIVQSISGPQEAFRVREGDVCRAADGGTGTWHAAGECPVSRDYARSHVAIPLLRGTEAIGTLCVASREERALGAAEKEFLAALAGQAAIAVEHARLDAEVGRLATLEERARIARDMHDGLAQSLSLLHLRIRQTQVQMRQENLPAVSRALEELAVLTGIMHDEIRDTIAGLRTTASGKNELRPALAEFIQTFSAQNRFPVKFSAFDAAAVELPATVTSHIIRIVQEALNNARKHAETDHAEVRVDCEDAWLRVVVEDRGRGFDPAGVAAKDGRRVGFRSMQERAERCAGKLEIESAPGHGTRVTVHVPLEAPA